MVLCLTLTVRSANATRTFRSACYRAWRPGRRSQTPRLEFFLGSLNQVLSVCHCSHSSAATDRCPSVVSPVSSLRPCRKPS